MGRMGRMGRAVGMRAYKGELSLEVEGHSRQWAARRSRGFEFSNNEVLDGDV